MHSPRSRRHRLLTIVLLGAAALVGTMLAGGVWSALLIANLTTSPAIPWAVIAMGLILWLTWKYLNGRWAPRSTSEWRRRCLRANPVSGPVFAWALVAGLLSIAALTGLWIVLFQLGTMPGNALPNFSNHPWLTVALALGMASLVASVAEEVGFRGYFQGTVEREVGGPSAIVIAALVIAPGHALTHGFVWATFLFYICVDVMFGVTARLTDSIKPGIVVHFIGILIFFTLVWPNDATRPLGGTIRSDPWFWIHAAQTGICGVLACLAFHHLAKITGRLRADKRSSEPLPL
ncbi:MAG TPA: type II CAAX endopeptidase family protein [Planctomycetaceae bacterium]|nr:type II CAAX endopeptidase family protein [Planctomycetaceae bacterium]